MATLVQRFMVLCNMLLMQVLKKLDMIQKNDIERILAERNILITVRNPFVVMSNTRFLSNVTAATFEYYLNVLFDTFK